MKLNKKGMMDDMFDILFTVMAAFFILLFAGLVLSGAGKGKEQAANNQINQIEVLNANNNFLTLLKMPVNEQETLLDLLATVSVKDRHEEFTQLVQAMMERFHPSSDRWGVSIYQEDEAISNRGYLEKYKNYDVGNRRCEQGAEGYMGKKPLIRDILIPQLDGTKIRLVYCIPASPK